MCNLCKLIICLLELVDTLVLKVCCCFMKLPAQPSPNPSHIRSKETCLKQYLFSWPRLREQLVQLCAERSGEATAAAAAPFGWHYLPNGTCLIQPHSCYVFLVVSRINVICYIIRHSCRNMRSTSSVRQVPVHPVSITRFPLRRFSPRAGLLRYVLFSLVAAKIFQGLGPKRRESSNGDPVYMKNHP